MVSGRCIFVTGGTGYIGSRLIRSLITRGHAVRALVREASRDKLPGGCEAIIGDALDQRSFANRVAPADTFVHLIGTPRPNPRKAAEFQTIDLASARAAVSVAAGTGIRHFVYLSVAQPAPMMRAYLAVRAEGERVIRESAMNATVFRPWYVLGPGHHWPLLLIPIYALMEAIPSTRESAQRLGLVRIEQMITALTLAIETPPEGLRVVSVPEIRGKPLAPQA